MNGFIIDKPDPRVIQLISLKYMIKLEGLGMRRNGRSATVIAKELLGMPKSTKREVLIEMIQSKLDEIKVAIK